MTRSPTIKDLARHLGISHSTVSRVLTGVPGPRAETREAVLAAAKQMQYVPNSSARLMKASQGVIIGLVMPNIQLDFYGAVTRILTAECRAASFQLMLSLTEEDPDIELSSVRTLVEARAVGIVIMPTINCRAETTSLLKLVPAVQIMRHTPRVCASVVRFDDGQSIKEATEHLLSLGHRRIAFITMPPEMSAGRLRLEAFLAAYKQAGLTPPESIYSGPINAEFGEQAAALALSAPDKPSAILLGSSGYTPSLLKFVKERGLKVPEELSIVTFGDNAWLELFSPAITAIHMPTDELAKVIASHLFSQITSGERRKPPEDMVFPLELRVRESTSILAY